MSNEKNVAKSFSKVIILTIVIMTGMSIGIFIIGSNLRSEANRYTEISEELTNLVDLAQIDVQAALQDDSSKHEIAYAYLQDLYILNNIYEAMEDYNATHPGNYTQQDFDEVAMEFTAKMRQLIFIVQTTWVYQYNENQLNATVANNYTYAGNKFYYIINNWYSSSEPITANLKEYVNNSFFQSGDPLQLPEIKFDHWTDTLYGNLSILQYTSHQNAVNYIDDPNIFLNSINLSISDIARYKDQYVTLSGKAVGVFDMFNNTLLTLAIAAVIVGFSASFDDKKYRKVALIIGLITLILSIVYFYTAVTEFQGLATYETTQILGQSW